MKTKLLKFGMPLMAFMLAIAFAFATEHRTSEEDHSLVTGYIYNHDQSDCFPVLTECSPSGSFVCTIDGETIFRIKNGTSCLMQLYKRTP